jgi:hypothetical protein
MYVKNNHLRKAVKGQALVETLVLALATVPILLLIVYLGKIQSAQQATIAASRALAFECQVSFDACNNFANNSLIADELRRRHFMAADTAIVSRDTSDNAAAESEKLTLWSDRRGNALLESYADVGFRIDPDTFNAGSGVAGSLGARIASNAMNLVSAIAGPGRFGLDWQGGLIDAKVETRLARSAQSNALVDSLNPMPLAFKAHTAILTDAWNASSASGGEARSTQSRVDDGSRIPGLDQVIDVMYAPTRAFIALGDISIIEPNSRAFNYHEVDVNVLPADRRRGPD